MAVIRQKPRQTINCITAYDKITSGYKLIRCLTTLKAETFAGRNFRVSKKPRNLRNKLSRFAVFGTNFVEKTFANRGKKLFSREKAFANEQKKQDLFLRFIRSFRFFHLS